MLYAVYAHLANCGEVSDLNNFTQKAQKASGEFGYKALLCRKLLPVFMFRTLKTADVRKCDGRRLTQQIREFPVLNATQEMTAFAARLVLVRDLVQLEQAYPHTCELKCSDLHGWPHTMMNSIIKMKNLYLAVH